MDTHMVLARVVAEVSSCLFTLLIPINYQEAPVQSFALTAVVAVAVVPRIMHNR